MKCRKCKKSIPKESAFCLYCGHKQAKEIPQQNPKRRGNGTGSVYRRGNVWQAQVTLGYKTDTKTGKKTAVRRSKSGFRTKKAALEYLSKLRSPSYRSDDKLSTLSKLWEGYSTSAMLELAKSSQGRHRRAYKKLEDIAYYPIHNLTIHDLQDHVDTMADTFYPAREIRDLLSHLYTRAVAQGDVPTNLAPYIILPPMNEREVIPFSGEELLKLWEDYEKGHQFTGYILFLIYSGTMPGELFKIEKDMIDWENQRILGAGMKTSKRRETPIVIANLILPLTKKCSTLPAAICSSLFIVMIFMKSSRLPWKG